MPRVYGLKRATGRMNRVHMNHMTVQKERLSEAQDQEADRRRKAREAELIEAEADAMRRCIFLEGEYSFYRWWNDDSQVPAVGQRRERVELIEKRIKSIEQHFASVLKENGDEEKSQEKADIQP